MTNEEKLAQIREWFGPKRSQRCEDGTMVAEEEVIESADPTPHRFWPFMPKDRQTDEGIEEWVSAGKPYEWTPVEKVTVNLTVFEAWLDFGYGRLALFVDGKLQDVGKDTIVADNCVVTDRDYYGSKFYLWPRLM